MKNLQITKSFKLVQTVMDGCPGICRFPGLRPVNPRDWDRDRDSKPRDSRDRDKNLRDSASTRIPRDNKSRHLGTRIPVSPWTIQLSQDSMWRKSRSCSYWTFQENFDLKTCRKKFYLEKSWNLKKRRKKRPREILGYYIQDIPSDISARIFIKRTSFILFEFKKWKHTINEASWLPLFARIWAL